VRHSKNGILKAVRILLAVVAGALTAAAFLFNMIGMIYSLFGRFEEGERMGALDRLVMGAAPFVAIVALVLSFWKPKLSIIALLLSPILLIETPVMYGRLPPHAVAVLAVPAALHLVHWALRPRRAAEESAGVE
jgi:hypothetical protein